MYSCSVLSSGDQNSVKSSFLMSSRSTLSAGESALDPSRRAVRSLTASAAAKYTPSGGTRNWTKGFNSLGIVPILASHARAAAKRAGVPEDGIGATPWCTELGPRLKSRNFGSVRVEVQRRRAVNFCESHECSLRCLTLLALSQADSPILQAHRRPALDRVGHGHVGARLEAFQLFRRQALVVALGARQYLHDFGCRHRRPNVPLHQADGLTSFEPPVQFATLCASASGFRTFRCRCAALCRLEVTVGSSFLLAIAVQRPLDLPNPRVNVRQFLLDHFFFGLQLRYGLSKCFHAHSVPTSLSSLALAQVKPSARGTPCGFQRSSTRLQKLAVRRCTDLSSTSKGFARYE